MTIRVDVWSDFVCPWCYAAALNLRALQQTEPVDVVWHSYELRPEGAPPMPPEYLQHIETEARPRFNQMMREQYQLEMNPGPFGISSRMALIADKYAEAQGNADFHVAVTEAYWLHSRDISQIAVLREIAEGVGLDGAAFEAVLSDAAARAPYDALVSADVRQAAAYGLQGVPAQIFNSRYLIPGAVPVDTLRELVAELKQSASR
jgi:predicted DsbA family dithiol-disulfide isomerase